MIPDLEAGPTLHVWPKDIPAPPPDPEGIRERLERDIYAGEMPAAAYVAQGLVALGIAQAAREECT